MRYIKSHSKKSICEKTTYETTNHTPMNSEKFSADQYCKLMRHIPATVAVIATGSHGQRNGLTCTSVCSLSIKPPTILVCVNHAATAHDEILDHGFFSINFLSAGQEAVARAFSGCTGELGEQRFKAGEWNVGISGTPTLSQCLISLECQISDHKKTSTHTILFGRVITGSTNKNVRPLTYVHGSYTTLDTALTLAGEEE